MIFENTPIMRSNGDTANEAKREQASSSASESCPEPGAEFVEERAGPRNEPPRQEITILVVEDQLPLRRVISRFLRSSGFAVETARDGAVALEKASHMEQLDLLITDMRMPVLNGRRLAQALRQQQPDLKVLFISGSPEEFEKLDLSGDERSRLLRKPFSPEQLGSEVEEMLTGE